IHAEKQDQRDQYTAHCTPPVCKRPIEPIGPIARRASCSSRLKLVPCPRAALHYRRVWRMGDAAKCLPAEHQPVPENRAMLAHLFWYANSNNPCGMRRQPEQQTQFRFEWIGGLGPILINRRATSGQTPTSAEQTGTSALGHDRQSSQ